MSKHNPDEEYYASLISNINEAYYTFQYRTVKQSPWGKPESPMKLVKPKEKWSYACYDNFTGLKPYYYKKWGNGLLFYTKAAYDDYSSLWQRTRRFGYTDLDHATKALLRVMDNDRAGKFDYKETYGKVTQTVRHHFRIVKVLYVEEVSSVMELHS